MKPLAALDARDVSAVLADIDDTLTTDGSSRRAYAALERSARPGFASAGDRAAGGLVRPHCPDVAGRRGGRRERRVLHLLRQRALKRLFQDDGPAGPKARPPAAVAATILAAVPGARLRPTAYRESDLAIDFCEDVAPLPLAEAERIAAIMRRRADRQGELHPRQRLVRQLRQAGDHQRLLAERFGWTSQKPIASRLCRRLAERRADVRFFPEFGGRGQCAEIREAAR